MMDRPILAGVTWWPHSGGRWLCRTLLGANERVTSATFVHPWLFFTTDMTLALDRTAQVHKARSLPDLYPHLEALASSVDRGRIEGIRSYFEQMATVYPEPSSTHLIGEMCLGSPEPLPLDLTTLYEAYPNFKLIQLVRNPISAFPSFASRREMDSDPIRIAGSWLTLNAGIRTFFERNASLRGNHHIVRYEDLVARMPETLKSVGDFLGLQVTEEMTVNADERWGRNTKDSTDSEISRVMTGIAGSELEVYGYV